MCDPRAGTEFLAVVPRLFTCFCNVLMRIRLCLNHLYFMCRLRELFAN